MAVKICDAIMGAGKSQSAIAYMNEHPRKKFMYITPYLDEVKRIKDACPALSFVAPKREEEEDGDGWSKMNHIRRLVSEGRNVSTTHAAFRMYTADILESIRQHGYTLIIDEAVQIMSNMKIEAEAVDILCKAGYIQIHENGRIEVIEDGVTCKAFKELFHAAKSNNLVRITEDSDRTKNDVMYYSELPVEFITSFSDVFVLTYLFAGSEMKCYFDVNGVPYEYIGVIKDDSGYHFAPTNEYAPEYCKRLSSLIHILDNPKLNSIGARDTALSLNWYRNASKEHRERIKKNIYNYFRHLTEDVSEKSIMWTTFKEHRAKIQGKGYTKAFVSCSARATNQYRDRNVLAYGCNRFFNPFVKRYFGGEKYCSDDAFALSSMVQWIWRSAIRDGKEIYIYVPSSRMRTLLKDWIERVENGRPGWEE